MTLDIFSQKLGDMTKPVMSVNVNDEALGATASKMLEAVQMVVDVMSDPKTGRPYRVGFAPGASAFTSRGERIIVISGDPLLKATVGTPLADIAAVLTGFAVHEVGHANRDGALFKAVAERWPGKDVPRRLANILEDVTLEAATIKRYAGFGRVFDPTLQWVAERTCPTFPIPWGTTTGSRVNCAGQVVRYRDFVTFATDPQTAKAVRFFDDWRDAITGDITVPASMRLIESALAFIHDHSDDPEPEPEDGEGPEGEDEDGEGPKGEGKGKGKGKPKDDDDTDDVIEDDEPEGDDGDGDGDGDGDDGEGGTEGGDSESDGEGDDGEGNGTEGNDGDGEGEGSGPEGESAPDGRGESIDTSDRTTLDKGANDGDGAGGSGQGVAEAGDPDDGYDPATKDTSFDEAVGHEDLSSYAGQTLDKAVETERSTTRLDAREHGTMRVIFR